MRNNFNILLLRCSVYYYSNQSFVSYRCLNNCLKPIKNGFSVTSGLIFTATESVNGLVKFSINHQSFFPINLKYPDRNFFGNKKLHTLHHSCKNKQLINIWPFFHLSFNCGAYSNKRFFVTLKIQRKNWFYGVIINNNDLSMFSPK